jgi:hypothetical protein
LTESNLCFDEVEDGCRAVTAAYVAHQIIQGLQPPFIHQRIESCHDKLLCRLVLRCMAPECQSVVPVPTLYVKVNQFVNRVVRNSQCKCLGPFQEASDKRMNLIYVAWPSR